MNRFAINITLLTVLLVGGGIYAYQSGIKDGSGHGAGHEASAEHGTEGHSTTGDQGLPTPEEAREDAAEGAQTTGDHAKPAEGAAENGLETPEVDRTGEFDGSTEQSKPDTGPQDAEGTQEENDEYAETDQDNSSVNAQQPAASGNAVQGKAIYAPNCSGCHGAEGQGGVGPQLAGKVNKWSVSEFATALHEGKTPEGRELQPPMPRYSKEQISDVQAADIHAFLSTLQ